MWDVDSKKILQDFSEHHDTVFCCDFSPDEKLVLSCDCDSNVLVGVHSTIYRISFTLPAARTQTTINVYCRFLEHNLLIGFSFCKCIHSST